MALNSISAAALLMSFTAPFEIWAGIELSKADYVIGTLLITPAILLNFIGVRKWICAQTESIDKEIEKDIEDKK